MSLFQSFSKNSLRKKPLTSWLYTRVIILSLFYFWTPLYLSHHPVTGYRNTFLAAGVDQDLTPRKVQSDHDTHRRSSRPKTYLP